MEYQATFGIDCGGSPDLGVKAPSYLRRIETFSADGPQVAYQDAMDLARKFVRYYFCNPRTDLTVVQLLSLRSSDGNVSFDALDSIVERSSSELLFPSEESALNVNE